MITSIKKYIYSTYWHKLINKLDKFRKLYHVEKYKTYCPNLSDIMIINDMAISQKNIASA